MTSSVAPHRYLEPAFLDALEQLATGPAEGNWWRDVLAHPELVLAIRRNSINAYYRGASIFRIDWKARQVTPYIHVKYLVRQAQSYVPLRNERFEIGEPSPVLSTYDGPETLAAILKASARYAGVEKAGLHPMLAGNGNVVDAEIALIRLSAEDDLPEDVDLPPSEQRQDRIDAAIAAFAEDGKTPAIRFYEAKHFSNPALRASGDHAPAVLSQIEAYENALHRHEEHLAAGYLETAKALLHFNEMRRIAIGDHAVRGISPVIRQIAESGQGPIIDTQPRLIIYGFDKAQRDDSAWKNHLKKLEVALPERVRAIGNPTRQTVFYRR